MYVFVCSPLCMMSNVRHCMDWKTCMDRNTILECSVQPLKTCIKVWVYIYRGVKATGFSVLLNREADAWNP